MTESKKEFINFILALEDKFEIKDEDNFENEMLKLIKEATNNKAALDIDNFENSFFEIIERYSSFELSDNIKKEVEMFREGKIRNET